MIFILLGHHVGLQAGNANSLGRLAPQALANYHPFRLALSDPDLANLTLRAEADGFRFESPSGCVLALARMGKTCRRYAGCSHAFFCLVDADFLDTEADFEGDERGKR